jgi:ankyrin repeat protein
MKNLAISTAVFVSLIFGGCSDSYDKATILKANSIITKCENSINGKDSLGRTPLHIAIEQQNSQLVKYLLEQGASLESRDRDGTTPFLYAVKSENFPVVKYLIKHGATVDDTDTKGSAFHYLAINDNIEIAEYLFKLYPYLVNFRNIKNVPPIFFAAMNGSFKVGKFLIENGADINEKVNGKTPLHYASANGNVLLIELFLKHGADIDLQSDSGTALHLASASGNIDAVRYLIFKGADINMENYRGSALHFASAGGHVQVVKHLIKHGARVTKSDINEAGELANSPTKEIEIRDFWKDYAKRL